MNLPRTVDEAVDLLTLKMALKDKVAMAKMNEDELVEMHFTLGRYIRNHFGLWGENQYLIKSARKRFVRFSCR